MAGLRPGESFLTAATRDRSAADKRAEAKRQKALTDAEDRAQRRSWVTSHSVFVPGKLAAVPKKKPSKPKTIMPGTEYRGSDKRTASQQASDTRRSEVRKLNTESRRKERFQLGLKTMAPKATIYDAVPVGATKHDQGIALALDHPPSTLSPKELLDWRKKMVGFSTFTPAQKRQRLKNAQDDFDAYQESVKGNVLGLNDIAHAGKTAIHAAADAARPITDILMPNPGGLDPRHGSDITTAGQLKDKYEKASDVVAGKSLTNLAFHGDVPRTAGEFGGLAAGVATIGPLGKAGRALGVGGKIIFDAVKAEEGIKAALEAGKVGAGAAYRGPSVTSQVIKWGKAARAARPYSAAQVAEVRANAGMLVKTREALVEAGNHDGAAQIEQILAKADLGPSGEFHGWDQAANDKRLKSKLNPKNIIKGVVYGNKKTVLNDAGIHVAGPFTDEQWVEKVLHAFPEASDRQAWAQWYEEFAPAFREMFGEHAEAMMRGFAVSQANNSPTGGLLATLRVLDRLRAGDTAATISNKGIGTKSLVKTIAKAVEGQDGKVDQGVAAKLSDFIDSFLKKKTRTIMGDAPEGGAPSAIDVHAMRDQGLVDKKLVGKLESVHGLKKGRDFVVDSQGAASGPLYERLSERYEQIARYLNDRPNADGTIGFDGRRDWEPREVQALGWGATQKVHGVDPENLTSAFTANTRQFNLAVGKNLTEEEAARVSEALAPHVEKMVEQAGETTFPVRGVEVGVAKTAKKGDGPNASLHFSIMSSPEKAQALADRLARVFGHYEVTAFKEGGSGAKPHLRLRNIPDESTASEVFASLHGQDPKRYQSFIFSDGEMMVQVQGKQVTVAEREAFKETHTPAVEQALDDAGIPSDHAIQYDAANLQILKGKSGGKVGVARGRGGGKGGDSLELRTDTEARAALDAAIGRAERESLARRAGRSLSQPLGIVPGGGIGGPRFARSIAESTARVNEEVAARVGPVPRFASEATPRTAEDVAKRVSVLDAKLDPIIKKLGIDLKREGFGASSRESLGQTDKPKYFQSYGQYEQAKQDAYEARKAKWKKKGGVGQYGGAHYTDAWPEWGEDVDTFQWGDPDTYALDSGAQVKTDRSVEWYRGQAEKQLMDQLTKLAQAGGSDGRKARQMLIMFQERESLRSLQARHAGADLFPEDVPAGGYGADLKATPIKTEEERLADALRPPSPLELPPRPTKTRVDAGGGRRPPVRPVARQLPDPEFDADYLEKVRKAVIDSLPSARRSYKEQSVLRSEEKANRLKLAFQAFDDAGGGIKGMQAMKEHLAGELPRLEWEGFEFLDDDAMNALINHAHNHPDLMEWEKIRVFWGLNRAKEGRTPTPSETELFRRAFGDKMASNLSDGDNMSIYRKIWQAGIDLWNTPRSLLASYDLSAPFRQGLIAGMDHPVIFARNMEPMIRAFGRDQTYLAQMDEIVKRPNWPRYEKMKLAITDATGSGAGREEAFPESYAERIPGVKHGVKASGRAYAMFLTKQRADMADLLIRKASEAGRNVDDPKFLDALGEFINTSTGRGRLPGQHGEDAAQFLNTFFFSPRLLASRFQILYPGYYIRLARRDPWVARQALYAAGKSIAEITMVLGALSRIPGVTVSTNPTNADFGQVRVGNTRIDLMGGFRPVINLAAREMLGRTTVSSTGENRKLGGFGGRDRYELGLRFFSGKLAPTPGLIRDLASDQKTFSGQPMTPGKTLASMLAPLNAQATWDAWKQDGYDMAAIALALGSIGFGTSSYPDDSPSSGGGGGGGGGGSSLMPEPGGDGGSSLMPDPGGGGGGSTLMPEPP